MHACTTSGVHVQHFWAVIRVLDVFTTNKGGGFTYQGITMVTQVVKQAMVGGW